MAARRRRPPAAADTRRVARATWSMLAASLLVHLPLAWQYRDSPFLTTPVSDALSYHRWASRIASEGLAAEPVFHQAPLFPLLLSWVYAAFDTPYAALALQIVLTSTAIAMLVPIARLHLGSAAAGVAAAVLALLHGPFAFHSLKLLYVPLALCTQALAWVLLGLARRHESRALALSAGLAIGVAALARPEFLLALPVAAVAMVWPVGASTRRPLLGLLVVAGTLAGVLPATVHNARQGDRVLIASSGGENLFIGNQRGADGAYMPLHPQAGDIFSERALARQIAIERSGRELAASEVSSYWRKLAWREIAADPLAWLTLEARKLGRVLHPGDPTDAYSFPLERSHHLTALHLLPVPAWVLLALGGTGALIALRRHACTAWPLVALGVVQLLALLVFFVNTRLRLPLLYVAAAFGGLALSEGWRMWRAGRHRRWIAASMVAMGLLGVAGHLLTQPRPRDVVRLASVLSTQQRLDESLEVLAPLLDARPPYALALDQAGWVLQKQGRLVEATTRYREALAAGLPAGRTAQTHTRLAMVLERLGEPDAALLEHDRAVEAEGANAGTHYERGMFLVRRGRTAAGVADLRRARELDPGWPPPRVALERLGEP